MLHTHKPSENAPLTAAGQLIALSHALPRSSELARQARALASRLNHFGRPPRDLALAASALIADLLDATDDLEPIDDGDDLLLDLEFDS